MAIRVLVLLFLSIFTFSCGGGGGGGSDSGPPPVPAANVSLSSSASSVATNTSVTLTWSSSNASSCTASGSWSGSKATSGNESVVIQSAGNNTFSLSCSGSGGSGQASASVMGEGFSGTVVDGYIREAEIFVDLNNNFIQDPDEQNTITDASGAFTISGRTDATIASKNGIDVDSNNSLDNFLMLQNSGLDLDFRVVTPITSVAFFLEGTDSINAILGIDPSIDINITDPIATMNDDDAHKLLYEKGSQITALVFSLQSSLNYINVLQESSETYFEKLAETLESQYTQNNAVVDIESPSFIDAYIQAIFTLKDTILTEGNLKNTKTALHTFLPIISVRNDFTVTSAISNYTTGKFISDFTDIVSGEATSELITSYETDVNSLIADDQNLDLSDLGISLNLLDDTAVLDEDSSVDISVLANDSIITEGSSYFIEFSAPSRGQAILNNDDSISYIPEADFNGTDAFTYTVSIGNKSATANVSIAINPIDDVPIFSNLASSVEVNENQTAVVTVSVIDVDGDTLTYSLTGNDAGSLSISSSGEITFITAPDYETKNSYSVTVNVSDGTGTISQALTININNVSEGENIVLTTEPDSTSTNEDTSVTLNILGNDTISTEGFELIISVSSALNGSITVNSDNTFTYTPSLNFFGTDTFDYTLSSGSVSSTSTVTITVNSINDLPIINGLNSLIFSNENQIEIVNIGASDIETSALNFSLSGADSSYFNISSSGVLSFKSSPDYETPNDANKDNIYSFAINVFDGTATISKVISVSVRNQPDLVSGVALDGYVAGATVFQDLDNDGVLDTGEPTAATNSLGSFSLVLSSVDPSAPVRIINGYDLATNEIHPSIMDISATETGSYIVTPISTLVGRLKIQDKTLTGMMPQSIVASALGISLSDSPNDSILGFDPISYFTGDDSTLASESKPIFGASQLLMALGGGNYPVNKYVIDQVLSTLSTTLTNSTGSSITMSSAADITAIKQDAYDAIFNGYVDSLASNPPINNVKFKNNKAVLTDYLNGSSSSQVEYSLYGVHDGSSTLVTDLVGAELDLENLKQIIDNDGTGTPMDLSFELASLPVGSGATLVTMKLFYGDDIVQDSDEDYIQVALTANWESDGTTLTIELPASSNVVAKFFDRSGTVLTQTVTDQEDIFTVDQDDPNLPGNLKIRLSQLLTLFPSEASKLSTFLDGNPEFTYYVELGNFDVYDHLGNSFNKIQGTFGVTSSSAIALAADDIYIHENTTSQNLTFRLSQASSSNVTVDYVIANESTASSSDFTLSSGTITIPAGSTSNTLAVAVTNDTAVESQEEIKLTLSNVQNAALSRSSVSVYITDGEEVLSNDTQRAILVDNVYKDSKQSINDYIKNQLDTSTVTISGTANSYSQVLINNNITSDVNVYVDSIVDDYEVVSKALINAVMNKTNLFVDAELSGFTSYLSYAQKLTQLVSGLKGLNISQIVGTNINADGTYPSGQSITTLQAAMNGQADILVSLAVDTVADILGIDTGTNFPNANVMIGTDGDDVITGTPDSDLIATFNGTDTVNAAAGNDKVLGGQGVDTFNGQEGNDHLYGYAGDDVLKGNEGNDRILGGLGNDTIHGDADDDDIRGETGNDILYSGSGSDTLSGGLGNDTFYITSKSSAFTDTIDGSSGTDTLEVSYSGVTSMGSFTSLSYNSSTEYFKLSADNNGGSVNWKNIENLTIGDYAYSRVTNSSNEEKNAYWNGTEKVLYLFNGASLASDLWKTTGDSELPSLSINDDVTVQGSPGNDAMNLNVDRANDYTGNLTLNMKDGNDSFYSAKLKNGDSLDMGAGDDYIAVMVGGGSGTPTIANLSLTKLDGGAGSDTISWGESGTNTTELTLTTGGATNFENIYGTDGAETIKGDANANTLRGGRGNVADTLYGYAGNDTLYGYGQDSDEANQGSGSKTLYGGAGNDTLYGGAGEDTLDGGTGTDTLTGGSGVDTFVIRSGDGSTTLADANVITDFVDGTDVIAMDGLSFDDLTIAQGTGANASHTLVSKTSSGEYLLIIQNVTVSNISAVDFSSASTDNQTFTGDSGNNTDIGGAGNDTFNGDAGNDTLYGHGGNDTFNVTNKSGSYTDTIDGGAGTDTLDVDYSGVSDLGDLAITFNSSTSYYTLTDSNGGTISFKNIETLVVGNYTYIEDTDNDTFWNATEYVLYMYDGGNTSSSDITSLSGFSASNNLTVQGSPLADSMNLNINRDSTLTGNLTLNMGAGNDSFYSAKLKNGDSIDMGEGDDKIDFMVGGGSGTPTIANLSLAKLDGGAGSDTMKWDESTAVNGQELTLTTGNATNFENIYATSATETIKGDANDNTLRGGRGGTDTIYAYAGNDTLYGHGIDNDEYNASNYADAKTLYGGAGNDILYGGYGDDTLDGGTGADTLYGGNGVDTFIIRAGDGGSAITDADTITSFTDGTDLIGMSGLQYSQLTVEQGSGSYSSHVVVKKTDTGEFLMIIQNQNISNIDDNDFSAI